MKRENQCRSEEMFKDCLEEKRTHVEHSNFRFHENKEYYFARITFGEI